MNRMTKLWSARVGLSALAVLGLTLSACTKLNEKDEKALSLGRLMTYKYKDYKGMSEKDQHALVGKLVDFFFEERVESGILVDSDKDGFLKKSQEQVFSCMKSSAAGDGVILEQVFTPCSSDSLSTFLKDAGRPELPVRFYTKMDEARKGDFLQRVAYRATAGALGNKAISQESAEDLMQASIPFMKSCLDGVKNEDEDLQKSLANCASSQDYQALVQKVSALKKTPAKGKSAPAAKGGK